MSLFQHKRTLLRCPDDVSWAENMESVEKIDYALPDHLVTSRPVSWDAGKNEYRQRGYISSLRRMMWGARAIEFL
jgi:hypothetical protein